MNLESSCSTEWNRSFTYSWKIICWLFFLATNDPFNTAPSSPSSFNSFNFRLISFTLLWKVSSLAINSARVCLLLFSCFYNKLVIFSSIVLMEFVMTSVFSVSLTSLTDLDLPSIFCIFCFNYSIWSLLWVWLILVSSMAREMCWLLWCWKFSSRQPMRSINEV